MLDDKQPATRNGPLTLDCQAIRHFMPHRFNMMLLDHVDAYHVEERQVVAVKSVSQNDPHVEGHFPDHPVFPGSVLVESLAQASGLLMNLEYLRGQEIEMDRLSEADFRKTLPSVPMTVLVDSKIKQLDVAHPGDRILLHTKVAFRRRDMCTFEVHACVKDCSVAEGQIMLSYPPYMDLME